MAALDVFLRMSNQLPPKLKVVLNLAISAALLVFAVPSLWLGLVAGAWEQAAFGAGLLLLGVFNLFT